jgi:hypothetical protein
MYDEVKTQLAALGIDLPPGSYTEKELEDILKVALSLEKYPNEVVTIPNAYDNPCYSSVHPADPRFEDYEFRKMILRVKKQSGLDLYSNPILSVQKLNLVIDLDWTMIYAFRTSMAYSEPQVELELKRLKVKYSSLKLEKRYIPSSQIYLIIALRPNLHDFLSKLMRVGTLHIYTSAEEEYARIVLNIIDPTKRMFENRLFAVGSRNSDSHAEKNLNLMKLEPDNVLIIDDQIDVWKAEFRDLVIPSMRFTPLFKEDHEFQTSKGFAEKIFTYVYEKGIRSYRDEKIPFVDDKGTQLEAILKVVNEVYEERFGTAYEEQTGNIYQKICAACLGGKSFSLAQILQPDREAKVNTFIAVIKRLGGRITDENPDFILVENLQNSNNANSKTVNWLILKYFGLSSK